MKAVLRILAAAILASGCSRNPMQTEMVIGACHLDVNWVSRQGFGNYQVHVTFDVDHGLPREARIVQNPERLEVEEQVKSCVASWKLPGLTDGTQVDVMFQWEHAKGWTSQTVKWRGSTLVLNTWGNPCQYCRSR